VHNIKQTTFASTRIAASVLLALSAMATPAAAQEEKEKERDKDNKRLESIT